ncbi:putative Zn finger protein [Nocardiopsis mwathae]|uniref:Putative Zn finger protein n=1 Tax=Nocardiopsis mwathae TaxID=1472723 RepID=A0A7X0D4X2_9ACTN|nr:hypothetical protein [Nocardiopsis mwathae]MBB6171575.1 putative Zn finger protein [Nocardiopsis mwathae]
MSQGGTRGTGGGPVQGRSWWSRRFVEAMESGPEGVRLGHGRHRAAQDAVHDLRVSPGEVLAKVHDSGGSPYRVSLILPTLDEEEWATVVAALAGQPLFRARLLAGGLPPEVERVFDVLGVPLFPRGVGDLALACSCPGWEGVCTHVAAVLQALAGMLDSDPFLLLAWLGRERGEFLSELRRAARAAAEPGGGTAREREDEAALFADLPCPPLPAAPPLPQTGDAFWSAPDPPRPPACEGPPQPVMLTTDPPGDDGGSLVRELEPLYERLTARLH